VKKISVQRQTVVGALLGMELGGENIIPSQRAGKAVVIRANPINLSLSVS